MSEIKKTMSDVVFSTSDIEKIISDIIFTPCNTAFASAVYGMGI